MPDVNAGKDKARMSSSSVVDALPGLKGARTSSTLGYGDSSELGKEARFRPAQIRIQAQAKLPSTSMPCKFFPEGRCMKGSACSFSHLERGESTSPSSFQLPLHSKTITTTSFSPCRFFLEGRCTKGVACPFKHPEQLGSRLPTSHLPSNHAEAVSVCTFFLKGMCNNGRFCRFHHPEPSDIAAPFSPSQHAAGTSASHTLPCRFFVRGACAKGTSCTFSHVVEKQLDCGILFDKTPKGDVLELPANNPPNDKSKFEPPDDFPEAFPVSAATTTRSILTCEVEFGSGVSVKQIITPFESRRIILSNLPRSASEAELIDLMEPLEGLGEFTIFDSTATARVVFEDCDQAARAVRYLDGCLWGSTTLASRLDLGAAIESGSGTLLSRKVKLSWFAPSVIAWAKYTSISMAQSQAKILDGKTFKGKKLAVSVQITARGRSACIEIKGLPLRTDATHLQRFTRSSSVTIGEPSYNRDDATGTIRALLASFGSLDSFDVLPADSKKAKLTAFAQYSSSASAAEAAKVLHDTQHDFLRYSRLWIEQIHCIKYTVSSQQFMTLKADLDRLQADYGVIAKLRCYDHDENGLPVNPVCIRIYGPDPKLLGRLKNELEGLLRGELFASDGKDVWDEYLETQEGQQFIDNLNANSACFVKCDKRTRTLRISGGIAPRDHAKDLITRQLETVKARRHVLPLEKESLRGLLMGGLRSLYDEIGMDKVVLDVAALTITVRGDESDVRKVRQAISAADLAVPNASGSTTSDKLCPVCFCDLSDPIELPCGHSYCVLCLQHLLRSKIGSNFSSVTCVAETKAENSDTTSPCGLFVPYNIIRQLLQPAEETALLEASFLSHIHARPDVFRYCPTPDCKVIYRPRDGHSSGTVALQCPACLARICARCHVEFHEGLTCGEHIENKSGNLQALQKWRKENGIKSCPKCNADLEKNGGCNHIKCILCGTHMCWVCMMTFPPGGPSQAVYDHMNRKHGGIGLNYDEIV